METKSHVTEKKQKEAMLVRANWTGVLSLYFCTVGDNSVSPYLTRKMIGTRPLNNIASHLPENSSNDFI